MSANSTGRPDMGRWNDKLQNWGRWPNDRGTLNLVTPNVVLRGLATVRLGESIPCSRPIFHKEPLQDFVLYEQDVYQIKNLESVAPLPTHSAKEMITFRVHNMVNTHIDGFSHTGYNGQAFNGKKFHDVVSFDTGAKEMDVTSALSITTRGVLVDVARQHGVRHLDQSYRVVPEDLQEALKEVLPGDAVLIRTGSTLAGGKYSDNPADPDYERGLWVGLHPDCVDLLSEKGVSVLGGDMLDGFPSVVPEDSAASIHVAALVVHGIHLLHGMDLEHLAERCHAEKRNMFFLVIGALNLPGATGSPVTPIAIL